MNCHVSILTLFLVGFMPFFAVAADASPLAGTWQFDPTRSTELSPWRSFELTIGLDGDRVTIDRRLGAGRRGFTDSMSLDLSKSENVIAVELWPDNRHLGAYIGGDRHKRVRATWIDDRRILRLSTDLILSTQQGERSVNILSDYKVSASGAQLTLTELRSTRNRPVVYVFKRTSAVPRTENRNHE
jgi:hypothetical protein